MMSLDLALYIGSVCCDHINLSVSKVVMIKYKVHQFLLSNFIIDNQGWIWLTRLFKSAINT